jgi:hypothetical protein
MAMDLHYKPAQTKLTKKTKLTLHLDFCAPWLASKASNFSMQDTATQHRRALATASSAKSSSHHIVTRHLPSIRWRMATALYLVHRGCAPTGPVTVTVTVS